ncbi:MAG: hypothetical protein AB1700_17270, partial [Bacillota bacterium]
IEDAGALCGRWLASTLEEKDLPPVSRGRERVAPPVEREAEPAFPWGTHWWRCKYEIQEAPRGEWAPEVRCIVAVPELDADGTFRKPEWRDVFTEWRAKAPAKQPKRPDGAEWDYAPHVALARLDPWNEQEVLRFVNRWGLLGLWAVESYKHRKPMLAPDKPGPTRFLSDEEEHSGWYIWDEFYQQSSKGLYMHSFCEPMTLFAEAAEEYQRLHYLLAAAKGSDVPREWLDRFIEVGDDHEALLNPQAAAREAEYRLSGWLHECAHLRLIYDAEKKAWLFGWQCNSLLGWVYLLTFLDLVQGRTFRRCARRNCGRLFIPTRPNAMYCSDACRNAEHQACHRERNPKPSGLRKSSKSLAGSPDAAARGRESSESLVGSRGNDFGNERPSERAREGRKR